MWTREQTVAVPIVPITLRISLPTWTRNRQGSLLVAVATSPPRLESKCAWAGRARPSRLCGCCECEDVSELSNWWIHLAGKIGAVITPPRQGCFVSGKSRKTLLCWSRWAFNDQPHSVAKNSNTVSNTYILSLNSQKQGCCTWISKPPHQSAVKFANWRWTQKNFPNTAPEMLAILGNIYETFVEH